VVSFASGSLFVHNEAGGSNDKTGDDNSRSSNRRLSLICELDIFLFNTSWSLMENPSPFLFDVFFLLSQLMNFLVVNVNVSSKFMLFLHHVMPVMMTVMNSSNLVLLEISFIIHISPFLFQLMFSSMELLPGYSVVFGMI
jgi:hypothetical protein